MTSEAAAQVPGSDESALSVFRNGAFLRLWLSQAATQIGGNMVLYGLTVIVLDSTGLNTVVSLLILTFLVPAVLFSAVAGVYVDRIDRRVILVLTNVLRGAAFVALYLIGSNLPLILLLNFTVSTITVFFAPAEAAMIPFVVERRQLLTANGIFTLTLNASFALGFALLGPLVVNVASPEAVIIIVAGLYFLAAVFCFFLPSSPPTVREQTPGSETGVGEGDTAVEGVITQLREGLSFIRGHRSISWSLIYLGITASLVGVLGVLGPDFAKETLGLDSKSFAVVVLPLGFGIVTGILLLNAYGKFLPRRRVIEGGLIALGTLLALLAVAGPISRLLQRADAPGGLDLSGVTSLLAVVVVIALLAGIAYGFVAIPSQTQLQEDLPEDVRGRVFGVLGMLVSIASFVPIIIVGPISDVVGTTAVLMSVAVIVLATGVASVFWRGPLSATDVHSATDPRTVDPIAAALGADRPSWHEIEAGGRRSTPTTASTATTTTATTTTGAAAAPVDPPATAPVAVVTDARDVDQLVGDPMAHAGPADPADRD